MQLGETVAFFLLLEYIATFSAIKGQYLHDFFMFMTQVQQYRLTTKFWAETKSNNNIL